MNPSRIPLLWFLIPFILGIVIGRIFPGVSSFPLYAASTLLAIGSFFAGDKHWPWLFVGSIAFAGYAYIGNTDQRNQIRHELPEREVTVSVEIHRRFETELSQIKALGKIVSAAQHLQELEGAIVYLNLTAPKGTVFESESPIGSIIYSTGRFAPLRQTDQSGGFSSYLRNSGVCAIFDRGTVHSITISKNRWKRSFNALLDSATSALSFRIETDSPAARSYRAMLLGLKSELSDHQKDLFLESGALHLFAISGLHIGVIAACGHSLFVFLRIPKGWIPIPNLILIAIFVLMTGGAPSAWRALLMIACYYLCLSSKRQSASINALALSASICLLINPLQLFLAGFQMSYVTVTSILLFGVPISDRLCELWKPFESIPRSMWRYWHSSINHVGRFIISSFAISLSAFLASSALSIIYFNTLSMIGILANVILLPLASLAIISGFLTLVFAIIGLSPAIALFNHAAILILSLMHGILERFHSLENTHLTFESPPIPYMFTLLAILLTGLFFGYNRLWRLRAKWLFIFPIAYTGICIFTGSIG